LKSDTGGEWVKTCAAERSLVGKRHNEKGLDAR